MARGTSGSLMRAMMKNIMPISATEVSATIRVSSSRRAGWKKLGTPATTAPSTRTVSPASIALITPERLKPRISSHLVMGVTM